MGRWHQRASCCLASTVPATVGVTKRLGERGDGGQGTHLPGSLPEASHRLLAPLDQVPAPVQQPSHRPGLGQTNEDKCHMISFVCGILNKTNIKKLIDTRNRSVVARGRGWWVDDMGEDNQKIQTSSCKINKSWGCNANHGDYS